MSERTLEQKWRLLAAAFRDGLAGREAEARFGDGARAAVDLLVYALTHDASATPRELDSEQVRELLRSHLPGRITGDEPWRGDVPDVLDAFLAFTATEEGLATAWDWTSAIADARGAYLAALKDSSRPRLGSAAKHAPDRRLSPKLGRNDPCFCGSGRKYKHCCWKLT
jgi:hypothetical protein